MCSKIRQLFLRPRSSFFTVWPNLRIVIDDSERTHIVLIDTAPRLIVPSMIDI